MNKICTSKEQSQKLVELRIDVNTADMCYGIDDDTLKYDDSPWLIPYHKYTNKEFYIPCWSLSALLDYLCSIDMFPTIENDYNQFKLTLSFVEENEERPISDVKTIIIKNKELVDACVEIILKLHELKLI